MLRYQILLPDSWFLSTRNFRPRPQNFRNGPGLRDAAARRERRVAIENFAERAEAVRMNLAAERLGETRRRLAVRVDWVAGECERAEQPAPDGSLRAGG